MPAIAVVLFSGFVLGIAQSLAAQVPPGIERVEERRAVAFYDVLRAGDPDSAVGFFEVNFAPAMWERRSPDEWRRMATRLIGDLRSMEMEGVDVMQPHTLTLTLTRHDDGAQASLEFAFEAQPPHRIAGLGIEMGGPGESGLSPVPPFEVPVPANRSAIRDALERYVSRLAAEDRFSGTVLVVHKGEIVFSATHGMASKRFDVPNRLDTRFDIGSINKEFTKVAIAQLMERGVLSLDDRLIHHLPGYPNRSVAERITIGQLADHTSGLGDIFSPRFFQSSRALYRSPQDYFPLFADDPLQFEPGSGRAYSNAGYIVLGAVIESVSGQPYHEYIQRHVFDPAGMASTGFFARDGIEPNIAEGYTRMTPEGPSDEWHSNMYRLPVVGNSAGSAQSTVEDLWRFDSALRDHELVSPGYTRWVFGGDPPSGTGRIVDRTRFGGNLGIAGGAPGVSAILESDGELVVVVLSNYDPPTAERMGLEIFRGTRRAVAGE